MNKNRWTPIILCIIASLILTIIPYQVHSAPPVEQNTIIIDINGNGDYTSIKDGIENATPTTILLVKNGIYKENNLAINKKITINGEAPSTTIVDCNGENGFILESKYVEISNLKIINTKEYAIYIATDSGNCIISTCTIVKSTAGIAVQIQSSSNTISNCKLIGNEKI